VPDRVTDIETSVPVAGLKAANWDVATVPNTGMVPEMEIVSVVIESASAQEAGRASETARTAMERDTMCILVSPRQN
jgi:hypothetical protein